VGVNRYDNVNFRDLEYAERDVKGLAELLKTSYQVRLLLGSAEGENRATRDNIERAFDQLLKGGLTKDDTFLIALAGHGVQTPLNCNGQKTDPPFFCPRDAVRNAPETLVNVSDWLDRMGDRRAGNNFFLIDACRDDTDPTRGARGLDGDLALN